MRKVSKYRNVKTGGFDSKKEEKRYKELLLLEQAGEIKDLQKQVKFQLIPAQREDGKLIEREVSYYADFVYREGIFGRIVVEDVKSAITRKEPTYIIKRKLMLHEHGIKIKEV